MDSSAMLEKDEEEDEEDRAIFAHQKFKKLIKILHLEKKICKDFLEEVQFSQKNIYAIKYESAGACT
jgi:hypothetical protein